MRVLQSGNYNFQSSSQLVHFEGTINICVLCLLDLRFFLVHVHFMICHWYFEFEKKGRGY
jgi:hypothetical protein